MFGSSVTPTPAALSAAARSPWLIAGRFGGRPVTKSPEAGGRSARMKYSCTGLVITMAPVNDVAFVFMSSADGFGSQTGAAEITPPVDADQPLG
jgi:hypothetical protein